MAYYNGNTSSNSSLYETSNKPSVNISYTHRRINACNSKHCLGDHREVLHFTHINLHVTKVSKKINRLLKKHVTIESKSAALEEKLDDVTRQILNLKQELRNIKLGYRVESNPASE